MLIKVSNYEHYNRALGKYVRSKKHYEKLMAEGGFIPFKEGEKIASKAKKDNHKRFKVGQDALRLIREAKMSSKNGKIKPSDRLIDGMKKLGVDFQHCPSHYLPKGGFGAV